MREPESGRSRVPAMSTVRSRHGENARRNSSSSDASGSSVENFRGRSIDAAASTMSKTSHVGRTGVDACPDDGGVDQLWRETRAALQDEIGRGVDVLRRKAEQLRTQLAAVQMERTSLEEAAAHLELRATEAETRIEDAEREADQLRQCVEQLKADVATRKERATAMRERIRVQDEEVQEATRRIEQLEMENLDFKKVSRVVALENTNCRLEQENLGLQAQLARMKKKGMM